MEYEFRKEITKNHYKINTEGKNAEENELAFPQGIRIETRGAGIVTKTAAQDFYDFSETAFGIKTAEKNAEAFIVCRIDEELDNSKNEYCINIADTITICGSSDRSVAQAFYYLEFCLKERGFPALKKGKIKNKMPYSPRMVHSGYGLDSYPDEYLSAIAHYGYDAIIVFVKGVNETTFGKLDFNDLCDRAEKYGIDVYAYSYISSFTSPKDKGAEELYDRLYGEIFKQCPKFKGMIFVGESVEFLSDDENVVKHRYDEYPKEGIPEDKPSPGWWPCKDYALWITKIRDSIRKYKKDADIVFWTYNWGWVEEEKRIALLKTLPTDISLNVTFEMFEKYEVCGTVERVSDYSLTYPYAGSYFLSEAKIAAERGIRLYAMCNTAGRTWDYGGSPYLPMPYRWIERIKDINRAQKEFGLVGLMEGHHYGFYPNFISRLAYLSFMSEDYESNLDRALKVEYGCSAEELKKGLKYIGESIGYLPPTIEYQYGPARAGTTYPLCLIKGIQPPDYENAYFGNKIWSPLFGQFESGLTLGFGDNGLPYAKREKGELKMLKKSIELLDKGIRELEKVSEGDISLLINHAKYLKCCNVTMLNVAKFYHEKTMLRTFRTDEELKRITSRIRAIAANEIANAEESIEYLEKDSSLGFEPTMLYVNSPERVLWKIEQVKYMLDKELTYYEQT